MGKEQAASRVSTLFKLAAIALSLSFLTASSATAIGVVGTSVNPGLRSQVSVKAHKKFHSGKAKLHSHWSIPSTNGQLRHKGKNHAQKALPPIPPQAFIDKLSSRTLAPGVVYKYYHGALNINVIDVDMMTAKVQVKPVLAGDSFNQLADVRDHAEKINAIAAVNANYFKKDGTPLGTLIENGQWVAGPLNDRVSLGISRCGFVRIDRVDLNGLMETSNVAVPSIWVNNINQPRRHGAHLIVYTPRWGRSVHMPYAGSLVAVNNQGEVLDKGTTYMSIPNGGFVLSDSKDAAISKLERGDLVHISWQSHPDDWSDVVQAVSGGPTLIKNGNLFLDMADEGFHNNWAGSQIHARTAVGVTLYNHLLLTTVEGPHTLYDLAKFLYGLGAVEAMNLDGGGSTTMVVNGVAVTRNGNVHERRVASALAIIDASKPLLDHTMGSIGYKPSTDLTNFHTAAASLPALKEYIDVASQEKLADFGNSFETTTISTSGVDPAKD
jgi:exopolysaccharide biosynthesis protein